MMYDLLLQLPLFQGMSQEQLTLVLEKVPFHFKKFRPNEYLIHEGDACNEIIFVLSGRVRMVTPVFKNTILIAEDFIAPHTIPYTNLFGTETISRSNVFAQGQVGAMFLDKTSFLKILETNRIMLVNVMNFLSANAQKHHRSIEILGEANHDLKIANWLLNYTSFSATNIVVDADVRDWCSLLNMLDKDYQRAVKTLEAEGCLEAQEGKLKLTDRYGLRTFVSRNKAQE